MNERREYTRICCQVPAVLQLPAQPGIPCVVRDLSFAGAHVDCEHVPFTTADLADGKPLGCTIAMKVGNLEGADRIELQCNLVYLEGNRAGLRITGAGAPDYRHFRNFLLESAEDRSVLLKEMEIFPNPAFSRHLDFPEFADWIKRLLSRGRAPRKRD